MRFNKKCLIDMIFPTTIVNVDMEAFWSEVDTLSAKEIYVMRTLYDQQGQRTSITLQGVADILGVSVTRIGQYRNKAIRRLRHPNRIKKYREFLGMREVSNAPTP